MILNKNAPEMPKIEKIVLKKRFLTLSEIFFANSQWARTFVLRVFGFGANV